MPGIKVLIGTTEFETKQKAETFVKQKIDTNAKRDKIERKDEDFQFFLDLIQKHIRFEEKYGNTSQVQAFKFVAKKRSMFVITNSCPNGDSISWQNCVKGFKNESKKDFICAARMEIEDQKKVFINENKCPEFCIVCHNSMITPEIDHFPIRFEDLLENCVATYVGPLPTEFEKGHNNASIFGTKNNAFAEYWSKFHEVNASLRFVCQHCNVSCLNTNLAKEKSKIAAAKKFS
jgi:hypothetical protein